MSAEEQRALVHRFFEAQDKCALETLDELLAPDFIDHSLLPGQDPGREGFMRAVAEDCAAHSEIRSTIEYQATDGDMVISRLRTHAIHDRGVYLSAAPTGQERTTENILIHRVVGGKIAEEWSAGETGLLMENLAREIRDRERVEQELRVARRIQQALLPKDVPELGDWQIASYYQPATQVGGDFYDFLELPNERLGIVIGDATGKGIPAALVMASARSMLRALVQTSESPGEVLRQVNDTLVTDIPPNMFVTCCYAILDPKSGRFTYANAGHDLPYLHHNGDAEELRARGMPLGLMPGMDYQEKEITLEGGDAALFYSDGLVEAHDLEGAMFGFPRLRELVAMHDNETKSLVDSLLEELYSFVGEGWEQEDDITLLTLRRSAPLS